MVSMPASPGHHSPASWGIRPAKWQEDRLFDTDQYLVSLDNFLVAPDHAVSQAFLQNFAKITPQYPGIRAPLDPVVCRAWLAELAPLLSERFGAPASGRGWDMQAWFSLVTTPPQALAPMQRLPHVDGTDPQQIAMMLYLHRTGHGGTAFFRHRSTGLASLTADTYPRYAAAVQAEYGRTGLPPAAYPTDGAPHFERIHVADGTFNRAIFYRGNILHSGVIDNSAPLSASPSEGRLTINAFFRPAAG
ncbi:MAG: DUF6445 family protein [Porphyrobacter sp.]|nr:DUF6445 family protein [Porphyrobacter sp.]